MLTTVRGWGRRGPVVAGLAFAALVASLLAGPGAVAADGDTATASSSGPPLLAFGPPVLIDRSLKTEWVSDATPALPDRPHWAQINLASPRSVSEVVVHIPESTIFVFGANRIQNTVSGYQISSLDAVVSNGDGNVVASQRVDQNAAHEVVFTFSPAVTADRVRINVYAATFKGVPANAHIAEITIDDPLPIVPVAPVTADSTSSVWPRNVPGQVIDQRPDTMWTSGEGPTTTLTPHWLEVDLGVVQSVAQVSVQIPVSLGRLSDNRGDEITDPSHQLSGPGAYMLTDFDVLASAAGSSATATVQVRANSLPGVAVTFDPPVDVDTIRLNITGATFNGVPGAPAQVAEIIVYEPYVAGPTPAQAADDFVESIGVADYPNYLDFNRLPRVDNYNSFPSGEPGLRQQLVDSGIRYRRYEINSNPEMLRRIAELGNLGVRTTALFQEYFYAPSPPHCSDGYSNALNPGCNTVTETLEEIKQLQQADALAKGVPMGEFAVSEVEGPNEVEDGIHNANLGFDYKGEGFPEGVRSYNNDLYDAVKSHPDPVIANLPVVTPSMGNAFNAPRLGDLSPKCDFANQHSYPVSNLPDALLDGPKGRLLATRGLCVGKPSFVTETGYAYGAYSYTRPPLEPAEKPHPEDTLDLVALDGVGLQPIPEQTGGKYIPRLLFEYYLRGIDRTTIYKIADDRAGSWGLIRTDGTRRPAYEAVKNSIAILGDSGSTFTPGALDYRIVGGDPFTVKHLLLQKSNGDFYLALWSNVESVTYTGGPTGAKQNKDSSQSVTLLLNEPVSTVETYLPRQSAAPVATHTNGPTSLPLNVPDEVMLVRITPAVGAALNTGPVSMLDGLSVAGSCPACP